MKIDDFDYFGSTVGNAFFSGISFDQLWTAVRLSENREQLDAAVTAAITLHEITNNQEKTDE